MFAMKTGVPVQLKIKEDVLQDSSNYNFPFVWKLIEIQIFISTDLFTNIATNEKISFYFESRMKKINAKIT